MRSFKVAFRCTGCGKCCTGKGGKVRVNEREVETIADYLSISTKEFRQNHLRRHAGEVFPTLQQTPDDSQCIFLEGKKCSIYPVRPTQCRTYPFWPQQLISKYDWTLASKECEGIHVDPLDDSAIVPDDRILKETVIHEVHRAGEELTYDEIDELISELEPEMLQGFEDEVATNYRRDVLVEDGTITILDNYLDGMSPSRSLHFADRLELVQSEVWLTSPEDDAKIDETRLALDVHRGLCLSLLFLPQDNTKWRVAMLGAGAGVLPTFWQHHLPHAIEHMHAIEPSHAMLDAGVRFFGLHPAIHIHERLGEDFVRELAAGAIDLLVVDVENGTKHVLDDPDAILRAPPASMTSATFFQDVHRALSPRGVVAANVIGSGVRALARRLQDHFAHVWVVELPKNAVVIGVKHQDLKDMNVDAVDPSWPPALQEAMKEFLHTMQRVD
ncbi:Aste57867_22970 [Aphanomyces stellatus]|uniref:Aste57867_22970 protein n=1 Tax=Aphanomyces stellatus TaxID=120398 RepID=A0A485LM68_9STRA|nr:hypothetical protein As57867_022899 [Aphanomyces stellatus]VFT99620.1 Aste57867_22970 [Aphanomyces stellatus]